MQVPSNDSPAVTSHAIRYHDDIDVPTQSKRNGARDNWA
jgi:hypothetical protein